jgi:hypothetical protein
MDKKALTKVSDICPETLASTCSMDLPLLKSSSVIPACTAFRQVISAHFGQKLREFHLSTP